MILHLGCVDKFTMPLWDFFESHLNISDQRFLARMVKDQASVGQRQNVELLPFLKWFFDVFFSLRRSEKVIIHGLFDPFLVLILCLQPSILKRCYWVIWGGDLYSYRNRNRSIIRKLYEQLRSFVIRRVGYVVTYIPGDVDLARKWYKTKGKHKLCICYMSNVWKPTPITKKNNSKINIMMGNSATESNRHDILFEKTKHLKSENVTVFCPLSYGDSNYAQIISEKGQKVFGDKFKPMRVLLEYNEYMEFLGNIDICVFAHNRQQGMGSTITLLGMGKKVFLSRDNVQWHMLREMGLELFDVEGFEASPLPAESAKKNIEIICSTFSEQALLDQWNDILR